MAAITDDTFDKLKELYALDLAEDELVTRVRQVILADPFWSTGTETQADALWENFLKEIFNNDSEASY